MSVINYTIKYTQNKYISEQKKKKHNKTYLNHQR